MNITMNLAQTRSALLRIVDRFGADHVAGGNGSTGCTYARLVDGVLTPVCIVGQLVADYGLLGVLVDEGADFLAPTRLDPWGDTITQDPTRELNVEGACTISHIMWTHLANAGLHFDEDAKAYLRAAQEGQDDGLPWGQAVKYADARWLRDQAEEAASRLGANVDLPPRVFTSDFRPETTVEDVQEALAPANSF